MKARSNALAAGCATALASILAPATALAHGTCYAFTQPEPRFASTFDGYAPFVLRYIPTSVGALTTDAEATNFGHLKQTIYSLVGKATALIEVCANAGAQQCDQTVIEENQIRLMTTVDGTIITGRRLTPTSQTYDEPGAHMGVNVHLLRRFPEFNFPFPVGDGVLECTTPQTSQTPNEWTCNLKVDVNYPIGGGDFLAFAQIRPFVLKKVNASQTPACSVFQDGGRYVPEI
jgi:hypothetical protein